MSTPSGNCLSFSHICMLEKLHFKKITADNNYKHSPQFFLCLFYFCCAGSHLAALAYFSSCGEWGPLSSCCGLLTVVACLADPGSWAWWLEHMGSVVVPPGL